MSADNPLSNDFLPHFLPQYTYVPGLTARPTEHAETNARTKPLLVTGQRLFDLGYYWEAHEAWEQDWITLSRQGRDADFVKGLIKLAACGVKTLSQNTSGATRHADRAMQLFQSVRCTSASGGSVLTLRAGQLDALEAIAKQLRDRPITVTAEQRQQAFRGGVPVLPRLPPIG